MDNARAFVNLTARDLDISLFRYLTDPVLAGSGSPL